MVEKEYENWIGWLAIIFYALAWVSLFINLYAFAFFVFATFFVIAIYLYYLRHDNFKHFFSFMPFNVFNKLFFYFPYDYWPEPYIIKEFNNLISVEKLDIEKTSKIFSNLILYKNDTNIFDNFVREGNKTILFINYIKTINKSYDIIKGDDNKKKYLENLFTIHLSTFFRELCNEDIKNLDADILNKNKKDLIEFENIRFNYNKNSHKSNGKIDWILSHRTIVIEILDFNDYFSAYGNDNLDENFYKNDYFSNLYLVIDDNLRFNLLMYYGINCQEKYLEKFIEYFYILRFIYSDFLPKSAFSSDQKLDLNLFFKTIRSEKNSRQTNDNSGFHVNTPPNPTPNPTTNESNHVPTSAS